MRVASKITPYLAFENQAEEAATFYVSVLPNSRLGQRLKNPAKAQRAFNAMLGMIKLDLAALDAAYHGTGRED